MIRVNKPSPGPAILGDPAGKGRTATVALQTAYAQGVRTFVFDSAIYGAKAVKDALKKAQHGKCAFCEIKRTRFHGDVEHFRPKAGWKQAGTDALSATGYYWLAYDWSNLYLSCQFCNQKFKKNLFPLTDPAHRANSHLDDLLLESSLLIDPGREDPAQSVGFRRQYAFAIGDNPRGTATIEVLGLNDEELAEERLDRLEKVRLLAEAASLIERLPNPAPGEQTLLQQLKAEVRKSASAQSPFSAMARAFLIEIAFV